MAEHACRTHPGFREGVNEDAIGWSEEENLWLVADGMGGHASGQIASAIARDVILDAGPNAPLDEVIVAAHEEIRRQAEGQDARKGMGTTIVVARIDGNELEVAWVGDSRAYLLRDGELRQITVDHSFVEMLRGHVEMSEEELRNHPQKNILTQTLGHEPPAPDVIRVPLRQGDRVLLCSDGLNDELPDARIAELLRQDGSLQEVSDSLVQAALDNGGSDNVSVVIVAYDGESHPEVAATNDSRWRVIGAAAFGVLAAMGSVLLLAWLAERASN